MPRHVVLTGGSGAFGSELKARLLAAGDTVDALRFGTDWDYGDLSRVESRLAKADLLVLAHGSKEAHAMEANRDSFVAFIELYRRLRPPAPPPEIWAVGSEIELHPAFGQKSLVPYRDSKRAFARYAARLARDPGVVYRHIVPAAFTSKMGPGLMSARTAVSMALFFIGRGWRYVPVTYTGLAFANWLKFRWLGRRKAR